MDRNHLGDETSPYLLQHADNPVHWHAWSDDAFARARAQNKPVLLSVGYAACHWCHVMAHESFENPDIAAQMNALFINIKVDREERPDIDALYQKALSLTGQQGGWPLTMFLTPDGLPFWGGTYFPPESRWGRPGFDSVLNQISEIFHTAPDKVLSNAKALQEALTKPDTTDGSPALTLHLLDQAAVSLLDHIDPIDGGLKGAPKFPMPSAFLFLWRAWRRTGNARMRDAFFDTLNHMSQGGIYDHLGGGFARYSTDDRWLVPHFEKMLYDNAQLIELLTLGWQETQSDLYAQRVEETVAWLTREMMAEDDAFAATLDADSEGEEGKFYVWTAPQIDALLGDLGPLFRAVYDAPDRGNWEHGVSILHRNHVEGGPQDPDLEDMLDEARDTLLAARSSRVRPGRDDKILADWNGLMIAALARAGLAFQRADWVDLAVQAFTTIQARLSRPDGRLCHSLRAGKVTESAILDDYANMARAALFLHEATGQPDYIDTAIGWVTTAHARYHDADNGGWYLTADDATDLFARHKTVLDSAVPSGNGTLIEVLARLYWLRGDDRWRQMASHAVTGLTAAALRQFPSAATVLNGFEVLHDAVQVVIIGTPDTPDTLALQQAALSMPVPTLVLSVIGPDDSLPPTHPATGKTRINNRATAYICRGPVCSAPVASPAALRDALRPDYPSGNASRI